MDSEVVFVLLTKIEEPKRESHFKERLVGELDQNFLFHILVATKRSHMKGWNHDSRCRLSSPAAVTAERHAALLDYVRTLTTCLYRRRSHDNPQEESSCPYCHRLFSSDK